METKARVGAVAATGAAAAPTESPDDVSSLLDPIEIEIGYGLIPLVGEDKAENLLRRVTAIRRQMATEPGVVLPKVRIRDNLTLSSQAYRIRVRGDEVAKGEVLLDHLLAIGSSDSDGKLLGVKTTEPAFGLPAVWITESQRAQAELLSCTIVGPNFRDHHASDRDHSRLRRRVVGAAASARVVRACEERDRRRQWTVSSPN